MNVDAAAQTAVNETITEVESNANDSNMLETKETLDTLNRSYENTHQLRAAILEIQEKMENDDLLFNSLMTLLQKIGDSGLR
jgi:hypothetical protein